MNPVLQVIHDRKSIRAYEDRPVLPEVRDQLLQATLRAPTAGNMMLYSILDITDQAVKDTLARTCDNQPFIARAPLVLLFLADYQRWLDYYQASDIEALCRERGQPMRQAGEGELFLACCDALIAAQTSVLAAESLGLGSCYIGDIMENYETHRDLLGLPRFVFPVALVCFGYPTRAQLERERTSRYERKFIVFENHYRRLERADFAEMFREFEARAEAQKDKIEGFVSAAQLQYDHKFNADFSREMTRSVQANLRAWRGEAA
jgi:FMN reductase (NADPH)/FMN reductase [NAD(P)H]